MKSAREIYEERKNRKGNTAVRSAGNIVANTILDNVEKSKQKNTDVETVRPENFVQVSGAPEVKENTGKAKSAREIYEERKQKNTGVEIVRPENFVQVSGAPEAKGNTGKVKSAREIYEERKNRKGNTAVRGAGNIVANTILDNVEKSKQKENFSFMKGVGFELMKAGVEEEKRRDEARLSYYEIALSEAKEAGDNEMAELLGYLLLEREPDFRRNSKYVSTKYGEPVFNNFAGRYTDTGYGDMTYELVNKNEKARLIKEGSVGGIEANIAGVGEQEYSELKDNEIAVYNYLYARDQKNGTNDADRFIKILNAELRARYRETVEEKARKDAEENPISSSIWNVISSPRKIKSAIGQIADYSDDGELEENALYNIPIYESTSRHTTVSNMIKENAGGFVSGIYDIGMGAVESVYLAALGGGSKSLTLAIMAAPAFATGVSQAMDRGLSSDQAMALGFISGAAEILTESIGFDAIFDVVKGGGKSALRKAMKENGLEEMSSSAINFIADAIIAKDKSYWADRVAKYKAQGMSEGWAVGMAILETGGEISMDGVSGVVTAAMISGPSYTMRNYSTGIDFRAKEIPAKDLQTIIEEGLQTYPKSGSYKLATKLKGKLEAGKPVSYYEYGKLYNENVINVDSKAEDVKEDATNPETGEVSEKTNTAGDNSGGVQYSIKTNSKGKYVQADRQVIFGNDLESWSEQLENYINGKIRKGKNVELIAEDGEVLTLTADTAGKVSSMFNNDGTTMREEAFERKVNAGSHIDELAQVSVGDGNGNVPDVGARHGEKTSGGWNYRTAYFRDFDGKYYQCTISVMVGEDGNAVYNIGQMRERSFPQSLGSSAANSGAQVQETSFDNSIPINGENVNGNISEVDSGGVPEVARRTNEGDARAPIKTGFVPSAYSGAIGKKTLRALDAIGKKLGVEITIGEPTGTKKGADNGKYENGRISVAQDAENPLAVVLAHEVTHHLKRTAPAEYAKFVEMAIEASEKLSGVKKTELIERYRSEYSEDGEFSDSQAIDEITADYAGKLVDDIELFRKLANADKGVAQRFIDSIKSFIAKVKSTFSWNKAKADTASQEKYGASVSELEAAVTQYEKMLGVTEAAVKSGDINTTDNSADGVQYSIKENAKGKYVQADRKVVEGKNPKEWGESVERFINDKIRQGEDVQIFADNGDVLTITEDSAGKAKFRNYVIRPDGTKTRMTDAEYLTKLNAESHIDELSKISKKGGKDVPDYKRHDFAKDGFNYRTAYFQDGDGEYYKLTISVGKNGEINTVYNVGKIEEASFPLMAHRPDTKGVGGNKASNNSIPNSSEKSNTQKSLKTGDLLSRDYKAPVEEDQGPSHIGENGTTGESSYIEDTGLDTYFDDMEKRAQAVQDKRIEDAEKALMSKPKTEKKSAFEKTKESTSFVKRKFVNSGDAIRKIAEGTGDSKLYPAYNRARSSMNIVSDMLQNKQTNIRSQKVGESLEGIIAPIKAKGDEYWKNFQLYLLHKHNVARMSIHDAKAESFAKTELLFFNRDNPSFATMSEAELEKASFREDDVGFKARDYIELRRKLRKAQAKNKPIFFDNDNVSLDAGESRKKAAELLRKNPGFKKDEASIRKYIDNLMQYRIDSGLITQEDADYFKKKYPDYVPTYRNTESVQKQMQGKTNIGKTVGKAKGGNDPILPLDISLSEMTKKVIRSGQKNIFANKVLSLFDKNSKLLEKYITDIQEGEQNIDLTIDDFGDEQTLDNTVGFYNNGKRIEMTVTPELFEAFDAISKVPKEQPAVGKAVRKVNDAYKKLITTWDPTFFIRNGFKDLQDAMINSRGLRSFAKNYPRAYKEIATNGEIWQLYQAAGGLYSSRFEELQGKGVKARRGKGSVPNSLDNTNTQQKNGKVKEIAGKTTDTALWIPKKIGSGIAYLNRVVEQAPRLAEFMSVVEKGDANDPDVIADALLASAEVTTNFGESGSWGKVLNAYYIPFLNPAIQGTARAVRNFTGSKTFTQWSKLVAKATILGLGAGFLNDILVGAFGDDEDKEGYENLTDRTKDNYFLFPTGDGEFIKLPKGRVDAALGIISDRIRDVVKGEDVDTNEALSRIAENMLPENPLNNNIFKAWFDADLLNEESSGRTWYGSDIESDGMQGLPVGERYDNDTDLFSKWLGEKLGVSPKKLNYILQQYTGGIGRMILPALTPSKQKGDTASEMAWAGFKGVWTSSFTVGSKTQNKISGEFYDAVDRAEQAKNSKAATLADKVIWKHLNRERNMMSDYNTKIRNAEEDDNLTSKERNAAVRAASAERTAYQKTILQNMDKYRESVEKFLKQYPGENEEKKIEYAYREANRAMYGAEYAIRVNGGSDVYKKAEEKVRRGNTTWEKYYDEYFGKTERRYKVISGRFDVSYTDFEKIENAMSRNSKAEDELAAIRALGYKDGVARRIRTLFNKTK